MSEPKWLQFDAVIALQAVTIAEHGGSPGLRDEGLLRSAMARAPNLFAYEQTEDIVRLAAAYGFGIARNHAFVDGDKRAAFLATIVFLEINMFTFNASEPDAAAMFLALAAGEVQEDELAQWLRDNSERG